MMEAMWLIFTYATPYNLEVKFFFSYSSMLYKHAKINFKRGSKLFTKKKNKINTPISMHAEVNDRHINLSLIHI